MGVKVLLKRGGPRGRPIGIKLCTAVGESSVMLSATKQLGPRVRSFAEFTLSVTNVLRMTSR